MSEMFQTIEKQAQEQAERERLAYEERQLELKRSALAKRRKATRSMVIRLLATIALVVSMSLAGKYGLMDRSLIRGIYVALAAWISFWLGAWSQFMWCKGGLLQ